MRALCIKVCWLCGKNTGKNECGPWRFCFNFGTIIGVLVHLSLIIKLQTFIIEFTAISNRNAAYFQASLLFKGKLIYEQY